MMPRLRRITALILVALAAIPAQYAAAAAQPTAPAGAPQTGAPSAGASPELVSRELVDVPGAVEPHTPAALNRGMAFRYFLPGAPAPSTIVVLIPGLNSGPNTIDILARGLLAAHGPGLEVWIVSPRPTLLQDRRGIEAALAYRHPDFALGYYYGSLEIEGHRFSLLKGPEVPYMAYWGLDVHLRDIFAIVREVRARYPRGRVVLGGHSLGGVLAAAYAGYDFAEIPGSSPTDAPKPPEIGAAHLAALLFIDGLPMSLPLHLSPNGYLRGLRIPFVSLSIPGVDDLTNPDPQKRVPPFTRTRKLARTRDSILFDVVSVYAYLRPEAPSYFPFYPRRFGLRITNEALAAALLSDQMQPDRLIRANVELPLGIFATVPDETYINPRGLFDLQSGYALPGEALIRLPRPGEGPAPRVPIRKLLAAALRPGADFTEWYFPWRLVLDLGLAASLQPGDAFAQRYFRLTHVRDTALPMLILGAGHGLVRSERATEFYRSQVATPRDLITVKIFRDFSHLDIEDADPNPAVPLILTWLESVVH
jgi:alpha-beta hydrolase superfamily lysophospholipase